MSGTFKTKKPRKKHAKIFQRGVLLDRGNNTATILEAPTLTLLEPEKKPEHRPASPNTVYERLRVAQYLIHLQVRDPSKKKGKATKLQVFKVAEKFGRSGSAVEKDLRYAKRIAGGLWWEATQRHESEAFRIEQMVGALDAAIKAKAVIDAELSDDEAREVVKQWFDGKK